MVTDNVSNFSSGLGMTARENAGVKFYILRCINRSSAAVGSPDVCWILLSGIVVEQLNDATLSFMCKSCE